MKIMVIFVDMLRANLLNTFNPDIKEGPVDKWFKKLGGTVYTNCYTAGTDTPRGLTCFYTGLYPKNNGCAMRSHWPKQYLKPETFTIFDLFEEKDHEMIIEVNKNEELHGIMPDKQYKKTKIVNNLDGAIELLKNNDNKNLFSFICLADYHWAMDDYSYRWIGDYNGQKHVSGAFEKLFKEINPDTFDYIFIFSDHGCKLTDELKNKNNLYLLNDDRTNITMFVHKKGDKNLEIDNGITTIMDILPTLNEIMKGKEHKFDGKTLFGKHHDYVVLEDQVNFAPKINSINEIWGVRTKDYFYLTSLNENVLLKVISDFKYETVPTDDKITEEFNKLIEENSFSYKRLKKLDAILKGYKKFIEIGYRGLVNTYSDGTKRVNIPKIKKILGNKKYKR